MHETYGEPNDKLGKHRCCKKCGHCIDCDDCTCKKQTFCICGCPREAHSKITGTCMACHHGQCTQFIDRDRLKSYDICKCGRLKYRFSKRCMTCFKSNKSHLSRSSHRERYREKVKEVKNESD